MRTTCVPIFQIHTSKKISLTPLFLPTLSLPSWITCLDSCWVYFQYVSFGFSASEWISDFLKLFIFPYYGDHLCLYLISHVLPFSSTSCLGFQISIGRILFAQADWSLPLWSLWLIPLRFSPSLVWISTWSTHFSQGIWYHQATNHSCLWSELSPG